MASFRVVLQLFISTLVLDNVTPQALRPPSFTASIRASPYYFSPNSGEVVTLPCAATGWPNPEYEWRFNENRLDTARPSQDGTLVFDSPTIMHQGYYQCIARNSVGVALSNKTRLLMATQASFEQIPAVPRTVNVGQRLVIPCNPRTNSVPLPRSNFYGRDYDWKIENPDSEVSYPLGRRVQIDENGNLNIAYVTMADNRPGIKITCFITNRISIINAGGSSTILNVVDSGTAAQTPPSIMFFSNRTSSSDGQSSTVVAVEGRNASLRCFFSGSDNIDVTWERTDGQLPTDGRVERLAWNTELFIKNVQRSDEGSYTCTGSASSGSGSFKYNFIVQAAPVFRSGDSGPRDLNATVGEDVLIQCNPYAIPEASIKWYRNGVELDPSQKDLYNRFRWSNNNRMLTVLKVCKDNCSTNDNGPMVIQCNASNAHGYAFNNGFINVYIRTVLTAKPADVTAVLGQTLNFTAAATSDPNTPIMYSWFFKPNDKAEGHPIVTGGPYSISADGTSLTILKVDTSVLGQYMVVASNTISQDSARFELLPPPGISNIWPFWWIPLIILILVIAFIIIVCIVCCCIYRNRGDEYPVDEKEREADRNPEQELQDNGFHDYQRPSHRSDIERQPLTYEKR